MASVRRSSSRKNQPGNEAGCSAAGNASFTVDDDDNSQDQRGYVQVLVKPLPVSVSPPRRRGVVGTWTEAPPWLVVCGSGAAVSAVLAYQALACHIACVVHRLCAVFVPVFALLCAYYWLSLFYRRSWTTTSVYLLSCACFVGEVVGQCLGPERLIPRTDAVVDADRFPGHLFAPHVHGALLVTLAAASALSSLTASANASVVAFVVLTRFFACTNLTDVPARARPFVAYGCGLVGVVVAKYVETLLRAPIAAYMAQDGGKVAVFRRRRTSSTAGLGVKARRTSLPAISLQKNHLSTSQHSSSLDVALLAEAHGLITDMLADTAALPQHVVSGLRALSKLLSPPLHSTSPQRPRLGPMIALTTVDATSGSESEEIPCMGEKIFTIPKRYRRNLPPSFLHRMSMSVSPWTTTTSATGMPTLEPEPSRKRSASFRHSPDASSPTYSPHMSLANQAMSATLAERFQAAKNRSYSTTSLVQLPPSPRSRLGRERKTVCSLHPLTASDIRHLHTLSKAAPDEAETDDDERRHHSTGPSVVPTPVPAVKRLQPTSDYDSSDSPNSSDNNETVVPSAVDNENSSSSSTTVLPPDLSPHERPTSDGSEIVNSDGRSFVLPDGSRFDLNFLEADPLWNSINEWDYSIFEVGDRSQGCILSQMCYRIFFEVGLFETFKIPLLEFFNYFHALEMGYQEKPYHNRTHAADVLHAVYYLTSQAIPGFVQLPLESDTPPPMQKNSENGSTVGLVTRQSFNAEDTYGIMGANFPALELMALYVASAMHDYDHPGRTNAFLVMTHAPQAVLYNDRSVLENHHAASAWSLLLSKPEFNFLVHLDKAEFKRFRFLVIEAILATDLKRHFDILREFNGKTVADDAPGLDWTNEADRLITMEMCIKLADISGPCKRFDLHTQWTHRIAEEFYEQGDEELSLGLPISPFMDRRNPQLAKLQESFITHLVQPLCHSYGEAGLLPGQWIDDPEDAETQEKEDSKDTEEEEADEERPDSNYKQASKMSERRISCLQTLHLKENHDYWITVIKNEEHTEAELETSTNNETIGSSFSNLDEMETINEEEIATERILKDNNIKPTFKDSSSS